MASEEDLRVAIKLAERFYLYKGEIEQQRFVSAINAALSKARAETWKDAIVEVRNVVKGWQSDVDESWDERPDLSFEAADKVAGAMEIITALEAAAGSSENACAPK